MQIIPCSKHDDKQDVIQDGYIFCFHPSQSKLAREVLAGLLVFLKGLWSSTINTMKFFSMMTQ